jgi:hypothetical protein
MNITEEREKIRRQLQRHLDDPIGREELGKLLGLELKAHEELQDQPIVAVLVPSYKSMHPMMLDARTRLLHYSKQFCTLFCEPIRGSSVVHWVRNDMLKPLYKEQRKFTHVLWIDDDMTFEPDVLVKLLRHDKDVIGVNYVTRSDPPKPNVHLVELTSHRATRLLAWDHRGVSRDGDLICAGSDDHTLTAGTGLMLVKREVLDRVGQMYPECEYEQKFYGLSGDRLAALQAERRQACVETGNYFWFQFLPRLCGFGESGEDTSFCIKAAMCGFKVWVDTAIQPGHMGEYAYSYSDYLPYQADEMRKVTQS